MKKANRNNGFSRNLLIWSVIVFFILFIYFMMGEMRFNSYKISFSEFLAQVESGQVKEVIIRGDFIEGKLNDGKRFGTLVPNYPNLVDKLENQKVQIEVAPTETSLGTFIGLLLSWFPVFLLIGLWFFFMRQMQGGSGKAMGFGKSKARLVSEKNNNITFADVAGIDEAKEELTEIVDFLKDPSKFQKLGGRIPKGCLLVGSPGTGKTLLAKAIAGEAKVPFFSISGSDFVEMFVGVGASRVRDMFEQAKKHAPCIIFIDEIDAVGRHRGAGLGGGNDEREQTLNQMLVEMDGFAPNEGIIVIAATNRPDVLDPALLRPGRFDRQIVVPVPDISGRTKILTVHAAKVRLAPDVDLKTIARGTPGFTGADLANLVNEAALLAARRNRNVITTQEMEDAKDKVMMGAERRSFIMTDEEKKNTAYHEAGHAIVSLHVPSSDPIHKATIIPRGRSLGLVMRLPENDRVSRTREGLKSDIAMAMGGRVAEELIFGYDKITTGASSDIKQATNMARMMVTQWGMSDEIGPVLVGDEREEVFLGHSLGHENKRSEALAAKIDMEVKKLVEEGYELAKKILKKHLADFHLLATNLLEYETLTGDEIRSLIRDKKLDKKSEKDLGDNTTLHSVPGMQAKPASKTVEVKAATNKVVRKKPARKSTEN